MNSAVLHEASIALAKLKAAGPLAEPIVALLALVEELESAADEDSLEIARLRHVEEVSTHAFEYHRRGYTDDPFHDEDWSTDEMNARMDELGKVLT